MNAFFLFNYLGRPSHKGPKESGNFIVKELKFSEVQLQQFNTLEDKHHNAMKTIGDDVKLLKDDLFKKITASTVIESSVDSLIVLISDKEKLKEKELFLKLRSIYDLCDEQQKEEFSAIIKKARKFDVRGHKRPKESKQ
jgi:hypothetical protein